MANTPLTLVARFVADTAPFSTALRGAQTQAEGAGRGITRAFAPASGGLDKATTSARGLLSSLQGIAGIIGVGLGLGAVVRETLEADRAIQQLRQALSLRGLGEEAERAFKSTASALQTLTGQSDEAILALQTMLVQFNVSAAEIPRATKAILDLSAATGIDARTAALQLIQATEQGRLSIRGLGSFALRAADETGRLREAVELLESKVSGAAEAGARGFGGLVRAIQNGVSDTLQAIGKLGLVEIFPEDAGRRVAELFSRISSSISDLADMSSFEALSGAVRDLGREVDDLASRIGSLSEKILGIGEASDSFAVAGAALEGFIFPLRVTVGTVTSLVEATDRLAERIGFSGGAVAKFVATLAGLSGGVLVASRALRGLAGIVSGLAGRAGIGTLATLVNGLALRMSSSTGIIGRLGTVLIGLRSGFAGLLGPVGLVSGAFLAAVEAAEALHDRYLRLQRAEQDRINATNKLAITQIALLAAAREAGVGIEKLTASMIPASRRSQLTAEALEDLANNGHKLGDAFSPVVTEAARKLAAELRSVRPAADVARGGADEVAEAAKRLEAALKAVEEASKSSANAQRAFGKAAASAAEEALRAFGNIGEAEKRAAMQRRDEALRAIDESIEAQKASIRELEKALDAIPARDARRADAIKRLADAREALANMEAAAEAARTNIRLTAEASIRAAEQKTAEERLRRSADIERANADIVAAEREAIAGIDEAFAKTTRAREDDARVAAKAAIDRIREATEQAVAQARLNEQIAETERLRARAARVALEDARSKGEAIDPALLRAAEEEEQRARKAAEAAITARIAIEEIGAKKIRAVRINANNDIASAIIEDARQRVEENVAIEETSIRRIALNRIASEKLTAREIGRIERETSRMIEEIRLQELEREHALLQEKIAAEEAAQKELVSRRTAQDIPFDEFNDLFEESLARLSVLREAASDLENDIAKSSLAALEAQAELSREIAATHEATADRMRQAFSVAFFEMNGELRNFGDIFNDIFNNIAKTAVSLLNEQVAVSLRGVLGLATPQEQRIAEAGEAPGPLGGIADLFSPFLGSIVDGAAVAKAKVTETGKQVGSALADVGEAASTGASAAQKGIGALGQGLINGIGSLLGGLGPFLGPLAGIAAAAGIGTLVSKVFGRRKRGEVSAPVLVGGAVSGGAAQFSAIKTSGAPQLPSIDRGAPTTIVNVNVQAPINVNADGESAETVADQLRGLVPRIIPEIEREIAARADIRNLGIGLAAA